MPSLSITSLDRVSEPASSQETASSTDRSTPFSFYPPLYAISSHRRPPSPSSFSPSPYVLNFKRRGPVQQQPSVGVGSLVDASTDSFSQQQLHRTDAVQGEGVTASAEPNRHPTNVAIENGMPKRSGEVLPENEVFEIELDKLDVSNNEPSQENQGFMSNDDKYCSSFSANMEPKTKCEQIRAPSSVSSLAINEELEFFDAPDSVVSDCASEDEIRSLTRMPGRWFGGSGETTKSRLEEEIARRIKAEESVALWQKRWNEMAKQCDSIGLSISPQNGNVFENSEISSNMLTQELIVARLVGGAIAGAVVGAEKDEEIESILRGKNQEISRLWDKLQYLELVNREMSQRNQEVIELTQRRRKRRQRRQKLALGGFCAAFCIGTVGLVCYKYIPWDHIRGLATLLEKSSVGDHSSAEVCRE